MIPACQACGACCLEVLPATGVMRLDARRDSARLTDEERRRYLVPLADGATIRARLLHDGMIRCTALRGRAGQRVECAIYPRRPSACRSFRRGGAGCAEAREALLAARLAAGGTR